MTQSVASSTGQNRTKRFPHLQSSSDVGPARFRQTLVSEELGFSSLIHLQDVQNDKCLHLQRRLVCSKPAVACHRQNERRRGRRMHPRRGVSTIPPMGLVIELDILMQAADANSSGQTRSSSTSSICSSLLLKPINSTPLIKPLTGL